MLAVGWGGRAGVGGDLMILCNVPELRKTQAYSPCCHGPGANFPTPLRAPRSLGKSPGVRENSQSQVPHTGPTFWGSQRWGEASSSPVWVPGDRLAGTRRVPCTNPEQGPWTNTLCTHSTVWGGRIHTQVSLEASLKLRKAEVHGASPVRLQDLLSPLSLCLPESEQPGWLGNYPILG